jgi:hypothetical protein
MMTLIAMVPDKPARVDDIAKETQSEDIGAVTATRVDLTHL